MFIWTLLNHIAWVAHIYQCCQPLFAQVVGHPITANHFLWVKNTPQATLHKMFIQHAAASHFAWVGHLKHNNPLFMNVSAIQHWRTPLHTHGMLIRQAELLGISRRPPWHGETTTLQHFLCALVNHIGPCEKHTLWVAHHQHPFPPSDHKALFWSKKQKVVIDWMFVLHKHDLGYLCTQLTMCQCNVCMLTTCEKGHAGESGPQLMLHANGCDLQWKPPCTEASHGGWWCMRRSGLHEASMQHLCIIIIIATGRGQQHQTHVHLCVPSADERRSRDCMSIAAPTQSIRILWF